MIFPKKWKAYRNRASNVYQPIYLLLTLSTVFLLFSGVGYGQDQVVTDDDVNEIASKLYCPVCENIPLDTCGTAACADWRYEIRLQLEQGMTEQEVIDDFVRRFGDRVVGTPQDPLLRTLSLATPYVVLVLASIVTVVVLIRFRTRQPESVIELDISNPKDESVQMDHYRNLLEQDLT